MEVHGGTASKGERHAAVLEALEAALRREEPFALVVVQPAMAPDEPMRAPKTGLVRYLLTNRSGMSERCLSVAIIANPAVLRRAGKLVEAPPLILGCPASAFDELATARDWSNGRLRAQPTQAGGNSC